eukprot:gene50025-19885_t
MRTPDVTSAGVVQEQDKNPKWSEAHISSGSTMTLTCTPETNFHW